MSVAVSHPDGWPGPYSIAPTARESSVSLPMLTTSIVAGAGSTPFSLPANAAVVEVRPIAGPAAPTVNPTTRWGLFTAPGTTIATVARYVPGAKDPVAGCTESVESATVTVNQSSPCGPYATPLTASPASVPVPAFETVISRGGGSTPPPKARNVTNDVDSTSSGAGACTVSVATTFCGLLLAPSERTGSRA